MDFTATWCGPCRMIGPYFEELSNGYDSVIFLKVDVDEVEVSCEVTLQAPTLKAVLSGTL